MNIGKQRSINSNELFSVSGVERQPPVVIISSPSRYQWLVREAPFLEMIQKKAHQRPWLTDGLPTWGYNMHNATALTLQPICGSGGGPCPRKPVFRYPRRWYEAISGCPAKFDVPHLHQICLQTREREFADVDYREYFRWRWFDLPAKHRLQQCTIYGGLEICFIGSLQRSKSRLKFTPYRTWFSPEDTSAHLDLSTWWFLGSSKDTTRTAAIRGLDLQTAAFIEICTIDLLVPLGKLDMSLTLCTVIVTARPAGHPLQSLSRSWRT